MFANMLFVSLMRHISDMMVSINYFFFFFSCAREKDCKNTAHQSVKLRKFFVISVGYNVIMMVSLQYPNRIPVFASLTIVIQLKKEFTLN